MEKFIMLNKEEKQIPIFEMLMRKEIRQEDAAISLNLSIRQVRNKLRAYEQKGAISLIHKNRGKTSKHKWNEAEEALAIDLLRSEWLDMEFGPTFAVEQLAEKNIHVSVETFRKSMIKHGLWHSRKRRFKKRRRRERKNMFGIMIQLDGSPHHWFGSNHPPCTLLVFIDDATSKIVWLEFVKAESVEEVMRATKNYLERYGLPLSLYVDYAGVFSVNLNNKDRTKLTQYERAMESLGIRVIHARSPQAKGRVERSNRTHQDRLVKELWLAGITTMEGANKFLPSYIEKHNRKFAVKAYTEGNAHREIAENLEEIFVVKTTRLLKNDYTVLYKNRILQLTNKSLSYKPKDSITISQKLNGELILSIRGHKLEYEEVASRSIKVEIPRQHKPQIPSKNSRRWNDGGWSPKHSIQQPTYKRGL